MHQKSVPKNLRLTPSSSSKKPVSSKPTVTEEEINVIGNTRGNLESGGYAAVQGEWIYYSTFDAFYKMKLDGSENKKIFNKAVNNINVVGDWIYYKIPFLNNVYCIKVKGGKEKTLLTNVCDFVVVKNKIFYTSSKNGYLYRVDTNLENETLLIEKDCRHVLDITTDAIYWGKEDVLYVSDFNGKIIRSIKEFYPNGFIVDGNAIYESANIKISDAKTGKEIKQLFKETGGAMDINISGDWIYFVYWEDKSRLYKIKKDGTQMTKLTDMSVMYFSVAGDWIFYTKKEIEDSEGILGSSSDRYKMRTDGSENQMISKWDWKYMSPNYRRYN